MECWLGEGEEGVNIDGFDLVLTDKRRNQNDGSYSGDRSQHDLFDHIFVRYDDWRSVRAAVVQTTVTDHYSTALSIALGSTAQDTPSLPITYTDRALFTDNLTNTNWEPVLNCCDTNECANSFAHIVSGALSSSKKTN
ncbi:hypothetical protein J6590_085749 [Homalodisca vitripennis]|nr:hypothetical protein J6590_085749 [Homalodisca vitripennis]